MRCCSATWSAALRRRAMPAETLCTAAGQPLIGPLLITPQVFGDDRGFFYESWNERRFRSDLRAALGLSQLQRLDEVVAERNRQLKCYVKLLASLPVQLLEVPEDVLSSVHLAVIRLKNASAQQHRRVFEELRSAGIGVQLHYSPVHLHPFYREMGFKEGQFPESESYARSAISLPLFPGLSLLDQQRVVDQLGKALKQVNLA